MDIVWPVGKDGEWYSPGNTLNSAIDSAYSDTNAKEKALETEEEDQDVGPLDDLTASRSSASSCSLASPGYDVPAFQTESTQADFPNLQEANEEDDSSSDSTSMHKRRSWRHRMRSADDDDPQDWWFASTAIPLLAATIGPLANVMSIAALLTTWRVLYDPANLGIDALASDIPDPGWVIKPNIASLVCGFVGNIFLMFNFTRRIRYIVALPSTIFLWYSASGILIAIILLLSKNAPPEPGLGTYSQGFWHAVIAAVLYMISSMLLMVNMLGYFLGHYPQHFELSDEQRNLILQTMMFFVWLAAGGGIFSRICGWSFADALYFSDVTVLTVGFGDFALVNDVGRGLMIPYSVIGIIMLGLVVSSIRKFAMDMGHNKIIRKHVESRRIRTMERAVTNSFEAKRRREEMLDFTNNGRRPAISKPFDLKKRTIAFETEPGNAQNLEDQELSLADLPPVFRKTKSWMSTIQERTATSSHRVIAAPFHRLRRASMRKPKLLILREEKDRFDAMRNIQNSTRRFKRYFALTMSVCAFGILWLVGAIVFWQAESGSQGLTYFQALYFCYVSLLTVGYGDLSPKSNAGKPFFILWSLIAVPTMTILISDMGETVVASYKRGTFTLAGWTVLPRQGLFRNIIERYPRLLDWLNSRAERARIARGFPTGPENAKPDLLKPTIEQLASEESLDEHELARKLALAIRRTAEDLEAGQHRRYGYEEWVEFSRLIRFSRYSDEERAKWLHDQETEGLIDWDWIGEDSPMMADQDECKWVLDRLCESLDRYMHRQLPEHVQQRRRSKVAERFSLSNSRTGSSRRASPELRRRTELASPESGAPGAGRTGGEFAASPSPPSVSASRTHGPGWRGTGDTDGPDSPPAGWEQAGLDGAEGRRDRCRRQGVAFYRRAEVKTA